MTKGAEELLRVAKLRFKAATEAEANQRERETSDLRFQVPEFQWDDDARSARDGTHQLPKRPMLSIPKLRQPLNLVRNQFRSAHLGVNIHPTNERASKENAQVRQDIYRRIETDSGAGMVRLWALDRAVQCGSGAYMVVTEYDEDTDDPFDQKIVIKRIFDQSQVYFDPTAEEPDRSDGKFAFLVRWLTLDDFKEQFPDAKHDYSQEFAGIEKEAPQWVRGSRDDRAILVLTYYCKVSESRNYVDFEDGSHGYEDEAANRKIKEGGHSRLRSKTEVQIHKLTAREVLESDIWPGRYIPLIPTIGEELQPFDGERRRSGLVGPAKDASKAYNYAVSEAVMALATKLKTPVVGYEGQFEGHEDKWDSANWRPYSYLEVKPLTVGDKHAPIPQPVQQDLSGLGLAIQLGQQFDQDIQASTAVFDPALGNLSPKERSGKAILALQNQADAGTSHYIQNMAQVSLPYEARVVLDAMPYVYDRKGRTLYGIDAEERSKMYVLNAHYTVQDGGQPQILSDQQIPQGAKYYDMSEGAYGVTVTIGKSYQSRLQAGGEQLGEIIAKAPDMMMIFGDIWARFLDVPGSAEIAERMLRKIEQVTPGLTKSDDQMTPEQLRAANQALRGKVQQLEQVLQQAMQKIQTDEAKQRATIIKSAKDHQSREKVAELQARTTLEEQDKEADLAVTLQGMKNEIELLKLRLQGQQQTEQRDHERGMARAQAGTVALESEASRLSEMDERQRDRDASAEEAARSREFDASEAQAGREFEGEQAEAERQAAMEQAATQPDGGDV